MDTFDDDDDYDYDIEDDPMGSQSNNLVLTLDEAREKARTFVLNKVGGMAYGFVTDNNGVLTNHERWSQPCYGEMRPYGVTHKDMLPEHQRKVSKPGDLTTPFPAEGNPVLAYLALYHHWKGTDKEDVINGLNDLLSVVLDPEKSPWRHVLKDIEVVYADKVPVGIIFNDTHVAPTVLISLWMNLRGRLSDVKAWNLLRETFPDKDQNEILLLSFGVQVTTWNPVTGQSLPAGTTVPIFQWGADYTLSQLMDVKRFLNGDPIIDGPTFFERGAYNRPDLHFVFGRAEKGTKTFASRFKDIVAPGKPAYHAAILDDTTVPLPKLFDTFHETLFA